MNKADFIGEPCSCPECRQAGVTLLQTRRDPYTGVNLHGYSLKRWYAARDTFQRVARAAAGTRGRHANGLERLVSREPGEEG